MASPFRPRGKPRCHDVEREKSYLSETTKDHWRCNYAECGITIRHLRNARTHVRAHLVDSVEADTPATCNVVILDHFSLDDVSQLDSDIVYEEDFIDDVASESHFRPIATSSTFDTASVVGIVDPAANVKSTETIVASSADLFNAVKLRGDVADRTALKFLHLMKLPGFDPHTIKEADVKRDESLDSSISTLWRCQHCLVEITTGDCSDNCAPTPLSDKFVRTPIRDQLCKILPVEVVQFWDAENLGKEGIITTCTQGRAHRKLMGEIMPLENDVRIITLTLNADGIQLFESSNKSVWPFFLVINELDKTVRFRERNILCTVIWEGPKMGSQKPPLRAILQTIADELYAINSNGLKLAINGKEETVKVYITKFAADSPAKAAHLNMIYHNGFYGCSICEVAGHTTEKGKGHNHSYAQSTRKPARRRTHARMLSQAAKAQDKQAVCGMKGEPHLTVIPYFDCSSGAVIDDMHAIFEGVVKKIVSLWFAMLTPENRAKVTHRMVDVKPPNSVSRSPRSMFAGKIKANEFRNFLFYYAIPCCTGIVPDGHLHHFALLVEAISILSKPQISTTNDTPRAREYLGRFCKEFVELYGENNYGINCHYLEHLTDYVEEHGSLPENSLFHFGSMNGVIKRACNATSRVGKTILRRVLKNQVLKRRLKDVNVPEQQIFVKRLNNQRLSVPTSGDSWKTFKRREACVEELHGLANLGCGEHQLVEYLRAELDGVDVWSNRYSLSQMRNCRFHLITQKHTKEETVVEIKRIAQCLTCCRLIVCVTEIECDCYNGGGALVSHMFVHNKEVGRDMCVYSDEYVFTPCFQIFSPTDTFYCAAVQWISSD